MNFQEYQEQAMSTAIYGLGSAVSYPILGLCGESGELANKYKKVLRDDSGVITPEKNVALRDELGDVLWYAAAIARDLGTNLEDIAIMNITKLQARRTLGTIHGSGDNR